MLQKTKIARALFWWMSYGQSKLSFQYIERLNFSPSGANDKVFMNGGIA